MLVRIPYTYIATATITGEPIPAIMVSSIEIDIPRLAREETEVVATWRMQEWHDGRTVAGRTVTCLYSGGAFYIPASPQGDTRVDESVVIGTHSNESPWDFIRYLQSGSTMPEGRWTDFVEMRSYAMDQRLAQEPFERFVFSTASARAFAARPEMGNDTGERDRKAAIEAAAKLVFFDGGVWRRVAEPKIAERLRARVPRYEVDFGDGLRREFESSIASPVDIVFHPLADLPEIVAAETAVRERIFIGICDLNLCNADVFRFDKDVSAARRTLLRALEAYEPLVGDMNAGAAEAFVRLRDAVGTLGPDPEASAVRSVLDKSLAEFLNLVETDELSQEIVRCAEMVGPDIAGECAAGPTAHR